MKDYPSRRLLLAHGYALASENVEPVRLMPGEEYVSLARSELPRVKVCENEITRLRVKPDFQGLWSFAIVNWRKMGNFGITPNFLTWIYAETTGKKPTSKLCENIFYHIGRDVRNQARVGCCHDVNHPMLFDSCRAWSHAESVYDGLFLDSSGTGLEDHRDGSVGRGWNLPMCLKEIDRGEFFITYMSIGSRGCDGFYKSMDDDEDEQPQQLLEMCVEEMEKRDKVYK